jgi:hypothetical protein
VGAISGKGALDGTPWKRWDYGIQVRPLTETILSVGTLPVGLSRRHSVRAGSYHGETKCSGNASFVVSSPTTWRASAGDLARTQHPSLSSVADQRGSDIPSFRGCR